MGKYTLTKAEALEREPIIKELFRLDRDGWACGVSIANDLFVGSIYDLNHAIWMDDTNGNRSWVQDLWADESFAREVK